ncbi:zinc finger MYM-type protein 1-like [Aphis craccivora]|uniref:Zinc finger MYM-type protein 1-like n=2 Tax=Aphis craccivora TaxID=307492 RepID=A0A6G0XGS0_APHCR|nr:zinc finger MYM-type protein 1-like [Aphis craccivora]
MIRGLYSLWKMPICYFLPATSVKNCILSELLVEVIKRLLDCGFHVKAVICDQGTNNVAALKLLKVTKDKPFFEVNERRIYSIFDTPHLFKNLRNHLKKSNFIFECKEVSFQDLRDVYDID